MDMPKPVETPREDRQSLEERVRECLDKIDSWDESRKEWEFIRTLNNKLQAKKKLGSRAKNLLKMIAPVIEKYGQRDPNGVTDDARHSTSRESGSSRSLTKSNHNRD